MKKYKRLTAEEREEISRMLALNYSLSKIAKDLERSLSTISREVKKVWGIRFRSRYRATAGHNRARRSSQKRRLGQYKLDKNKVLFEIVKDKLRLYWSPEQIACWLKSEYEDQTMHVSKETIYTYIYVLPRGSLKKELLSCLRRQHAKRRVAGQSLKGQTSNLEDMLNIDERPEEVADRCIPGHWEGDLIIGGRIEQSAMGTLVERTTRTVILVPLKNKKSEDVRKAFTKEIMRLPKQMRLSMTYDQGREMAQHKLFTKNTKMKVYFAHPRSPWERGTNENTNGLIRQFFPKGTNFNNVSRKRIKEVQDLLNGRPRKTLEWKTPFEAMDNLLR